MDPFGGLFLLSPLCLVLFYSLSLSALSNALSLSLLFLLPLPWLTCHLWWVNMSRTPNTPCPRGFHGGRRSVARYALSDYRQFHPRAQLWMRSTNIYIHLWQMNALWHVYNACTFSFYFSCIGIVGIPMHLYMDSILTVLFPPPAFLFWVELVYGSAMRWWDCYEHSVYSLSVLSLQLYCSAAWDMQWRLLWLDGGRPLLCAHFPPLFSHILGHSH